MQPELSSSGQQRVGLKSTAGPAKMVTTKGYGTTLALSTLKNLLVTQVLRRGNGIIATPQSRRKERLFGSTGSSRSKRGSTGVKLATLAATTSLTSTRAFVRLFDCSRRPPLRPQLLPRPDYTVPAQQ